MPSRKPSASTIPVSVSIASGSRAHRSQDSSFGLAHSQPPLGSTGLQQQKIVQVLVHRLKNKLPCHSGMSLDRLEADKSTQEAVDALVKLSHDSLDTIVLALCELIERLAKLDEGEITVAVLQSQLFVLKVLATAMSSRWHHVPRSSSQASSTNPGPAPDSPLPSSSLKWSHRSSFDHSQFSEPNPMEDNCARYLISVMVLFLRQSAQPDSLLLESLESSDVDFRDFEDLPSLSIADFLDSPVSHTHMTWPAFFRSLRTNSIGPGKHNTNSINSILANTTYERSPLSSINSFRSLNSLIEKFTGRIIFHISASNWPVVFSRVRVKIRQLAQNEMDTDSVDLQLLSHSALDKGRLVQVLSELSSLLVSMSGETHLAFANPLRLAIWNWINHFPEEYNDVIRGSTKMDSAPERVFDYLSQRLKTGTDRQMWPALAALLCITPDRISPDLYSGQRSKSDRFLEDVRRALIGGSKNQDVGLVCALDLCRAAMYITQEDAPLRSLAGDLVHEIKSCLFLSAGTKPFWDSSTDVLDMGLYAEVLVALYRFVPIDEALHIFSLAMEPERSDAAKICVFRAAKTLSAEASLFPFQPATRHLVEKMQKRYLEILTTVCVRRAEVDQFGNMRRAAVRPKAKRTSDYGLTDREVLMLALLSLVRTSPEYAEISEISANLDRRMDDWAQAMVRIWEAPYDNAIKLSMAVNSRLGVQVVYSLTEIPDDPAKAKVLQYMVDRLPETTICIATNVLTCRTDASAQRMWLQMNVEHLALALGKAENDLAREIVRSEKRIPGFLLSEIGLLVCLTSADNDTSQLAAQGLRLISFGERIPGVHGNPLMTSEEHSKRMPVYDQLGDPNILVHGRVLHQKRIRKLLRLAPFPLSIAIPVWEECYWRWKGLSELVATFTSEDSSTRTSDASQLATIAKAQWQNLALFLASMGGVCVQDQVDMVALSDVIPAKNLPDQLRVRQNTQQMAHFFVRDMTRHLLHDDITIRDTARDALGSELDHKLYGRLIKHLEETVASTNLDPSSERSRLIGEQCIAVLKLMVDNEQERMEEMLGLDITLILQALAAFLQKADGGPELVRLKIKFCTLCDSTAKRADTLTLKKDNEVKRAVLNIVSSWLKPLEDDSSQQPELNMACLRTTVKLLERLDLRDMESQSAADDGSHYVTREFSKYFKVLQLGLAVGCQPDIPTSDSMSDVGSIQKRMKASHKEAEVRELVITGLAHLVSSDPEVGLKQCLDLAYGDDHRNKAIFAHVFARVIGAGAKFKAVDQVETTDRYKRLSDLVKEPNLVLAQAICNTCPTNEIDQMIAVLLNIFNTRSSLMSLLKFMITREVTHTENESSLFRSNSIYNRFLSAFAKIQGYNYLRQLILPIVKSMADLPQGQGYELDPSKSGTQNLGQNQQNIQFLTTKFLELIFASRAGLPPMFREVCTHIHDTVKKRWPDNEILRLTAVGGFLFLRFISPAVVAPETIDIELPNESLRRGLMLIAKIIQNLANNVMFGKEPHMKPLNTYLTTNVTVVTEFFSIILQTEEPAAENQEEWAGGLDCDDTDGIVLHRFFDKHADKIGKELLSTSKPVVEGEATGVTGKRTWDNLCTLLVDLGQPLEVPRVSPMAAAYHKDYQDLKARYANRSTASVEHMMGPIRRKELHGTELFFYRARDVDVETVDFELVLCHILKCLEGTQSKYDLVVDCTGFRPKCILPLRWLKYCVETLPSDLRARLGTTYILNNNMEGQRYMKRVFSFCAGVQNVSLNIQTVSSVEALMDYIPDIIPEDIGWPAALELEPFDEIVDATIKVSPLNPNQPAVIRIATSHVRITCLSAGGAVEIIPMADISDVYVHGTREKNEFIIRKNKQDTTLYLSSLHHEHIVKSIRAAKGRIAENHTSLSDRFSRYSNIPATLLHVGMLNVDSPDEEVRTAAYDLLGAVCTYLNYEKHPIIAPHAGFIPGDPSIFVVLLSERVAEFAPQLTLDFISEVTAAMKLTTARNVGQAIGCLYYLSPWIKNLAHFTNPTHPLFGSTSRLRDTIRGLSDLSMSYPELRGPIQKRVWSQIGLLATHAVDIILDELLRGAIDSGAGSSRCEAHAHVIASFTSISMRGRLFAKLRKAIIKASPRQTKSLVDSHNWNEVSTLTRICLIAGYQTKMPIHNQLYIPEVVHSVMMIAGLGATIVRKSVYGITVNLLQSLFMARSDDVIPNPELLTIMAELSEDSTLELFGLRRTTSTSEYTSFEPTQEFTLIDHHERLAKLLVRILEVAAGNKGLLNVWRARWMSLVTSSAFQYSAMIQMRSFTVLGVLATSSLDDDFLYQALVAFSSSLSTLEPNDTLASVGILRAISKLVPGLPDDTRFLPQLFWMGVAFLQSGYINFYADAARLVQITLEVMDQREVFKTTPISTYLLNSRTHLEDDALALDQNLGLSFDSSFTFSLAAIIFKGVRRPGEVKDAAESLLRTLLRVTMRWRDEPTANGHSESLHPDVLGYFIALLPLSTSSLSYTQLLRECHVHESWLFPESTFDDDATVPMPSAAFLGLGEDQILALFTVSFISAILVTAQGDDTETQILYSILSDTATIFPEVVSMAYESLQERIKDTFANSSNACVIRYVSDIIRVALQDNARWNSRGSASTLNTTDEVYPRLGRSHHNALDDQAMAGLGSHFKFLPLTETFQAIVPHLVRIVEAISQPIADM